MNDGEALQLEFLIWVGGYASLGVILVVMLMHHQRWRFSLSLILVLATLVAIGTASWVAIFRMAEESERRTRLQIEREIQQQKR